MAAVLCGILVPSISIFLGEISNAYNTKQATLDTKRIMKMLIIYINLVGFGCFIFGYIYYAFWQHVAENVTFDIRSRYLRSILKQEISFFEMQNVEQMPSLMGENFTII